METTSWGSLRARPLITRAMASLYGSARARDSSISLGCLPGVQAVDVPRPGDWKASETSSSMRAFDAGDMFLDAVCATHARAWARLAAISGSDVRMAVTSSVMRAAEEVKESVSRV